MNNTCISSLKAQFGVIGMRIVTIVTFLWIQLIAIMFFFNKSVLALSVVLASILVIGVLFIFYPSTTRAKLYSVFLLFNRLFKRKLKKLSYASITFMVFVIIISSYFGLNTIVSSHYDDLFYSKHFSSGDFQVHSAIFGIEKTSELESFFTSVSSQIYDSFNNSAFPGEICKSEWFVLLDLQFDFYYEYRNVTGELIKGTTGLNGYLLVTNGSLWEYLMSIHDEGALTPDYFLFRHNISLVEPPDLGFAKNISFIDPFSYNSGIRYVFLNSSQQNCSKVSLGSYESTLSFQKEWDLPALPGAVIVCSPDFFKQLFPEEEIIQPNNEMLRIEAEWRGWIRKSQSSLQQYNYTEYYNHFKHFLLNGVGANNILGISSNFIDYYQSLSLIRSNFSNNFLVVEVPFFILGLLLFFFGYKELATEEKELKKWFQEQGLEFPSPFMYNFLKTAIIFLFGFISGAIISICFLLFPMLLFSIPIQYIGAYFFKLSMIIAVSLEALIISVILFYSYELFIEDSFILEKTKIFSIEQLTWVDYSLIFITAILYPLVASLMHILNVSQANSTLGYLLLGTLFGVLSIFVVIVLRKFIQRLPRLVFFIFKKMKYVWYVGNKIYTYLVRNASGIVLLMVVSLSFIHFSTSLSFSSIDYYRNISGMYVGADIKLSGLNFGTEQMKLIQNITAKDVQSYTIFHNLTMDDFRGQSNHEFDVQYHIIGINTTTFAKTAFFSEYFFDNDATKIIESLKANESLICSSTLKFFNAKVGDNITLDLPVLLPLGSPYEEFTFSVVGTFKQWPGYNNLNTSDPIYSNNKKPNLVIVVSLETFNQIQSIASSSSSNVLMKLKNEKAIDNVVRNLKSTLLRYYAILNIEGRYIPSSIADLSSMPELVFLLSFMSIIFLYSIVILVIALFLLVKRYSTLLAPVISRLYGHGFTTNEVLSVLITDTILSAVSTLIFALAVSVSYHYAYLLILSNIFYNIPFTMKWTFELVTLITFILIVCFHTLLSFYFTRKVGTQKEIDLPRVIV